jgi:FkbM family methyltransferase
VTELKSTEASRLLWLRVRKVAASLRNARTRHGLRLGTAPAIEHAQLLRHFSFDFIVDVGANRGQFLVVAAEECASARINCFEPLPAPFARLQQVASSYGERVSCTQIGLSDRSERVAMFVTKEDDSSSLLQPTQAQLELSRGSAVASKQTVQIDRLDARAQSWAPMPANSLLKIDVQGTELAVLEGAGDCLAEFFAVYVECSFVELYAGQSLAPAVISYLERRGFDLCATRNMVRRSGRPVQADLLFLRRA